MALERVERSSGSLIGGSIASIQKSTAPEVKFVTIILVNCLLLGPSFTEEFASYLDADASCTYG